MFQPSAPALRRTVLLIFLLAITVCWSALSVAQTHRAAGGLPHLQTAAPSGKIVVKLARESQLVLAATGLAVRPGAEKAATAKAASLKNLVSALIPGNALVQRIPAAEILPVERATTRRVPDLALYGEIATRGLTRDQLVKIVARLNRHPQVELAFLEPVAVPAALGFDAFTGATPAWADKGLDPQPPSGNYQELQGYLEDAPLGVGALTMRPVAGQRGAGVTVIDIEGGWLWSHEDLPQPVFDLGEHIDDLAWRNHGTAVMGEIAGQENLFGVTGIVPEASVGNSSIGGANTAAALAAAIAVLQPGDLILIELHAPGPLSDGQGQYGYLPMEYWQDNFDAIRLATSKGILVCEAAGNGYQNLDDPAYLDLFDRSVRDSGAIMCGATSGSELHSADFSNHGQRVDLNGWGWWVTTTGYGDLFGEQETEFYTGQFSGTSSASPIVTSSVASLQGMVREMLGFDLDARLARDLLRETGTPMEYGTLIGTRPNLVAAHQLASETVGELKGAVTDQDSGLPLAGVSVQVAGHGSFTSTDAEGFWRLPLQAGPVELDFSSFLHRSAQTIVTTEPGQSLTVDIQLEALPLIDIQGVVYSDDLTPLEDVTLTCVNQPVSGALSANGGSFVIASVPADHVYLLRADGRPGFGAQVVSVDTWGFEGPALVNPLLPVTSEDFESGAGDFISTQGFWQYGAPPADVTGGAFDGSLCWGVGMGGSYEDDESGTLISPVYDLSGETSPTYYLSFHYYAATEGGFDGVGLEAGDGASFTVLHPLDGYTDPTLSGLGGLPGWSGQTGRWQGAVFDISDFVGGNFQFRLNWGSDGGLTEQGFYIDGIAFGAGSRLTPAPDNPVPDAGTGPVVRAWPNPFNPRVTLEYALSAAGPVDISVYDMRGRKVRQLLRQSSGQARGSLTWDGRNDAGQQLSSGVYFVMVRGERDRTAVSRVVLSK